MNKHPNVSKVYELAMMFDLLARNLGKDAEVSMMVRSLPKCDDNVCGTPACHAGWFGFLQSPAIERVGDYSCYTYGMSEFLMCESINRASYSKIESWAENNPEIWGNSYGGDMFADYQAFGVERASDVTLELISRHWYGVAERLEKHILKTGGK